MALFQQLYGEVFATFGYPLTERASLSPNVLDEAERASASGSRRVLLGYYLIAGRERRFNACHNRLLPPSDWSIDQKRLIFMEENQSVLWWGVSIRNPDSDDPPVSQGLDEGPITWRPEHRRCSVFLAVMLHHQAVSGGFRFCGSASVPEWSSYRFEEHGWTYAGDVGSLLAYRRPNQVVCLEPPGDLPFMQRWSIHASGKTRARPSGHRA